MTRPNADETRDYRWRISMRKKDWVAIVAQLATEISYCNFKDEIHKRPDQSNKHSAYLSVWSAMLRVQQSEDHEHRPADQMYFNNFSTAWPRELDYATGRFDDPDPIPTKTIRSVQQTMNNRED
jgi:hypothetical protein